MLARVTCPCCKKKFWLDFAIDYEIYASSLDELEKYVLKEVKIKEVWKGKKLEKEIRLNFNKLSKLIGKKKAIDKISRIYGVPVHVLLDIL